MQQKTEELLNVLLWAAEGLSQPTFRNLTDSYECWAYRNGLFRQISRLEKRRWIEPRAAKSANRLYRLTEAGRLHVLGGRDPEKQWSRNWDGRWRLVIFDVPAARDRDRVRLRRYLRRRGFGYLQKSVWVTPDPLDPERQILCGGEIDVESLVLLEAWPCAGESNEEIVSGAWDFELINRRYSDYLEFLSEKPVGALRSESKALELSSWGKQERQAWLDAVMIDPLLPNSILPSGYLGKKAWERRIRVLSQAFRQVQGFRPGALSGQLHVPIGT